MSFVLACPDDPSLTTRAGVVPFQFNSLAGDDFRAEIKRAILRTVVRRISNARVNVYRLLD
jgi:hypothetical protein